MDNDQLLDAIKDMFENAIYDMNRKNGILLERMESKIELLAEGHGILNDKLDSLETKLNRLEARMDRIEIKLDRIIIRTEGLVTDMVEVKDCVISEDPRLTKHDLILKGIRQ